ncbi:MULTISPECIES: alpha/beta-type small acid-soluble spore protein [Bacillaceae]|uniref:alpha/beta-type small acid-soluble spore protein n=1 Tax=Bacillaceae TaxID=186817 RepID=UPI000E735638|nr:alpha/beta-type small acid-soluble spore protein [Bacillus sp. PK3_68]RJS61774.1 alpha/beta hydrolase [Bacillus sp. PK3_68]
MSRKNKILVPEAKQALDNLKAEVVNASDPAAAKFEAAKEVGVPLTEGYNGKLTSEEAGQIGGRLGGSMVRELINMAKKNLRS